MAMNTEELRSLVTDEVITHSYVRDVALPGGRMLALLTLDNGRDHTRPNTLGPATLMELSGVLDELAQRAGRGEIAAVAITGKPFILAAGADLSKISEIPSREIARQMAQLGHETFGKFTELGVPSFVFINGLALGGGLEVALNADYRTIDSSAAAIAAQGLLRLGRFLKNDRYWRAGLTVCLALFQEPYLSAEPDHEGLLLHSVYHRPNGWDFIPEGHTIPCGEASMWGDYHARELALYILRIGENKPYLTFWS